jgi:hypothetical protein
MSDGRENGQNQQGRPVHIQSLSPETDTAKQYQSWRYMISVVKLIGQGRRLRADLVFSLVEDQEDAWSGEAFMNIVECDDTKLCTRRLTQPGKIMVAVIDRIDGW